MRSSQSARANHISSHGHRIGRLSEQESNRLAVKPGAVARQARLSGVRQKQHPDAETNSDNATVEGPRVPTNVVLGALPK